jgi:class 3 adenylate cyclase
VRANAAIIAADDSLRARARAGYYDYEVLVAGAIAGDLGLAGDALIPRVAATAVIAGLRELYETSEANAPASVEELIGLVDRVIAFARAGLAAG